MTHEAFNQPNDPNQAGITAPVTQEIVAGSIDQPVRALQGPRLEGTYITPTETVTAIAPVGGARTVRVVGNRNRTAADAHRDAGVGQDYEKPEFDPSTLSAQDQSHYRRGESRIRREAEKHAGHTGSGKGEATRRAEHIYNTVRGYTTEELIARGKVPTRKVAASAIKGFFGR